MTSICEKKISGEVRLNHAEQISCGKVKHELRVQIHELRVPVHELRVQIHELRVQIHELED